MANTPNLGLHQWQPGDSFLRTDFNTDFSKIDTAVEAAKLFSAGVRGSYTGTGTENSAVTVGFRPSCVLILGACGGYNGFGCILPDVAAVCYNGLILNRMPNESDGIPITDTGFLLKDARYFNRPNSVCHYFVMR